MKFFFILISYIFFTSCNFLIALDYGNYLAGESAYNNKHNKEAIIYFEKVLDVNNINSFHDQDVAQKLCTLYLLEGNIKDCISLGKKIEDKLNFDDLDSINILMTLIVSDIKEKKFKSALSKLKKIKKSSYERFSVPIIESWLIAEETKNLKKSNDKLNELEQDLVINGLRYLNQALLHEHFNKKNKALEYYNKALNSYEKPSYRTVKIAANAFERNSDFDKAKETYLKFIDNSEDTLLIENDLNRIKKKELPKKEVNNLDDVIAELFSGIASTFNSDFTNNFSIIYSHFSLFLKEDFEVSNLYLAELMENNKRYEYANNLYKKIKPTSNFFWHSKLKTARNLEIMGKSDKSIPMLKKMINEKEDRYDALKLLGDIYRNNNDFEKAINFYNKAVNRIEKINVNHWDLLYSRGIALERNNKWNLAEKDFLTILEFLPNQPDVLNYLSYSWIEKGINLDKAKDFIIKAVSSRPRDPYIVDSLGWAYYRLEEYENAVKELEKAVDLKPTDPIINDHLGDAYYQIGRKLEALYQWKKAIDFKPEKELEKKIKKKIENFDSNKLNFI